METQRVERKCNVNQTRNTVLEQNETKKTAKKDTRNIWKWANETKWILAVRRLMAS